ncbi:E3 ubiquitin-protein ligase TRIM56-like [Haliotis cracherodii]|uniref:E3 ubiquitin-protein ligase TRIM56-like n=1 Tax=Haliotis cracherodii TaxID=6455 RepID=UPI0039E7B6B0
MAAARKLESLNENFLTCSICTEGYKDPCTLTCGHTFCKGCLGEFLKTRQDVIRAKSIPCPYCRQMTRVPQPDRPVEEWVKEIKPSFLIQGLLDTLACGGGTDHGNANDCFSCKKLGDKSEARSHCQDCSVPLCDRCVKMHLANPATSEHDIGDIGDGAKVSRRRRQMCTEHNEVVDFCCRDCNKAICQKCCIIYHRTCISVVTIQSLMSEMKRALTQNEGLFRRQFEDTNKSLLQNMSQIDAIDHNKASVESEIRNASQRAIDVIKQKEKQLLAELNDMADKQSGKLRRRMKSKEIDMQMYQQYIEYISQVLKSMSETDMFDIYQNCQSGAMAAAADRAVKFTDVPESEVVFISKIDVGNINKHVGLGRLELGRFDIMGTPLLSHTVNPRLKDDIAKPDPHDAMVVDVDGEEILVIADYNNKCLKSFFTKDSQSQQRKLKLASFPHSLSRLGENLLALAFWSSNEILVVQVTPDPVLQSRVTTKKKYRCLAALSKSILAAGCVYPACVDILDISGVVLRSISTLNAVENLLCGPRFLCATPRGHILVSNDDSNFLYCMTPEGKAVFTYRLTREAAMRGPRGITTTRTGHILVADKWTNKETLLTAAGEFVRDLLTSEDGIEQPYGLSVHGDKLFVTQRNTTVKVFHCSRSV